MDTVSRGRHALAMAFVGVFVAPLHAEAQLPALTVHRGEAVQLPRQTTFHVLGDTSIGIRMGPRASLDALEMSIIHDGGRGPKGFAYGILAHGGAELSLTASHIVMHGASTIGIQAQRNGLIDLSDTVIDMSYPEGGHGTALALAGGTAVLRGTSINALPGHAISTHFAGSDTSHVSLQDSTIRGRIGSGEVGLNLAAVGSGIDGDIVRGGTGALDVSALRSTWRGTAGNLSMASFEESTWTLAADSSVAVLRLGHGGKIVFDRADSGFRTLHVGGWHADAGAVGVVLGTRLDAGGTLNRQATDRLLIAGDANGTTPVQVVRVGGKGASTAGRDGVNGPADGISLVQVGGEATAESMRLVGDYVAVGSWQYRLRAYEPGHSDPGQRLLNGDGSDYWDFRLQSTRVDAQGRQDGEAGVGDTPTRAALAPQVPTYLVLSHALFGYGMAALDALGPVDMDPEREPALHVHAFGGNRAYRSTLPFVAYGVDYKRYDRGVQIAGNLLVHAMGDTTLRAGAAVSLGGTRVVPHAADGRSDARVDARGMALHAVLTTESDWRVASSYAMTHYRVDVRSPSRGEVLGRLRANANEAALSAAYRWRPVTRLLVEPGVSTTWQRLRFSSAIDGDGIDLQARTSERTTLRAGARASLDFLPEGQLLYAWSPYVDLRYKVTRGAGESVRLSGECFATGRAARGIELSTGVRLHLWSRVTTYVDMTTRLRIGQYGESGLTARAGLALAF